MSCLKGQGKPLISIKPTKKNINEVIDLSITVLEKGGIIACPTETFYGLGAKFDKPDSLKRLYKIKKRPKDKAMPVIIGSEGLLQKIVLREWLEHIPESVKSLMEKFWPGPLTILLPASEKISDYLTAGTGRVAVRVPGESFALQLAARAGFPLTATSANPSGMPPAETPEAVVRYFGDKIDLLIEGGRTPGGLPSTIVDVAGRKIRVVREGAVKRNRLL